MPDLKSCPSINVDPEIMMHRRGFLRAGGSSMAAFAPWPWAFRRKPAPPPPKGVTQMGEPQPFSYADLK
ncbi:MAG: hypothetical protein ACRET2_05565, partial [Steroidobacteraceae bacterium]